MFRTSDKIGAISKALAAASPKITAAAKDAKNPHFKSDYATLESVWKAGKAALDEQGVFVLQSPGHLTGNGTRMMVTRLLHGESGEWIEGDCEIHIQKRDPQGDGSTITYGRRYALAAILNIPVTDDDGHMAVNSPNPQPDAAPQPVETIDSDEAVKLEAAIEESGGDKAAILRHFKARLLKDLTPDQAKAVWKKINEAKPKQIEPEAA